MASDNVATMLGVDLESVLRTPLCLAAGGRVTESIRTSVEAERAEVLHLHVAELATRDAGLPAYVDAAVHRSGDRVVVELEPADGPDAALLSYRVARGAMQRLAAPPRSSGSPRAW